MLGYNLMCGKLSIPLSYCLLFYITGKNHGFHKKKFFHSNGKINTFAMANCLL